MAGASTAGREDLKINDLDWLILDVMSDGRRYTPAYLYRDLPEFDDHGDAWVRTRIGRLSENGLIENLGESSMYEITDWGIAALTLKDELQEAKSQESLVMVMDRADELDIERCERVVQFDF